MGPSTVLSLVTCYATLTFLGSSEKEKMSNVQCFHHSKIAPLKELKMLHNLTISMAEKAQISRVQLSFLLCFLGSRSPVASHFTCHESLTSSFKALWYRVAVAY